MDKSVNSKTNPLATRLRKLENRLESLVEGSAARLFPSGRKIPNLAHQLVDAMWEGVQAAPQGEWVGPNYFSLHVQPSLAQTLSNQPMLVDELTRILQQESESAGFQFASPLVIQIVADPQVPLGEFLVHAQHSQADLSHTSTMIVENQARDNNQPPDEAFLIVNGMQVFPLRQSVVNIGRRPDNDLVVDDARVSRLHAQLRLVRGQYIIFDLASTGGTWVNGQRVHQKTLVPGDVVSLSGVPLVYGHDTRAMDETQPQPSSF